MTIRLFEVIICLWFVPVPFSIVFSFFLFRCVIYRLPDPRTHITRPPAGVIFPKKVCIWL